MRVQEAGALSRVTTNQTGHTETLEGLSENYSMVMRSVFIVYLVIFTFAWDVLVRYVLDLKHTHIVFT